MGKKFLIGNTPVLFEKTPFSRVGAITIWSKLGSRDELNKSDFGLTHFLEHMVFKGTEKRNAKEIAEQIEGLGGELDAFTSRDNICLICKIPKSNFEEGFKITSDLILNSKFEEKQINLEKSVVKEELRMAEDDFEDSSDEFFMKLAYPEPQLGRSILGNFKSIENFSKKSLKNYLSTRFNSNNMVISVGADVDEDLVVNLLSDFINSIEKNTSDLKFMPNFTSKQIMNKGNFKEKRKGMEGVNISLAFETFNALNENRYTLAILNNILGNGMSSRLFQKIREEKGLAYSIYSSISYSRNEGNLFIGASTSKNNYEKTHKLIEKECFNLFKDISINEFEKSKTQLKGILEMGVETSSNFAFFNARNQFVYNKLQSVDEILEKIDKIKYENVKNLAKEILNENNSISLCYGNI